MKNIDKPKISIIATGGTIASRVDYRTGAVTPITTAEDLLTAIPELKEIAEIKARTALSIFSENMQFEHYKKIAKAVAKEKSDGTIITHGTDTMHYTSAALSFMLQNLPTPAVLVGAQRSSDRGSSDAALNLICAALFAKSDAAGVFVCMHENESDKTCLAHSGIAVRKMHTSRRDAFKSINRNPIARIDYENRRVNFLEKVQKRDENKKTKLFPKMEEKVALVKTHPNINPDIIRFFMDKKYKGIILEGTGLGHVPETLTPILKDACEKMVVCMASQCIFGRVNMNVYSTGRDLLAAGVIPCEMLPEVAFIKLAWLLGNFPKKARELLGKNLVGEIPGRIITEMFL